MRGLTVCRRFYFEQVKEPLEKDFPTLKYSSALLGSSPEALGYDGLLSQGAREVVPRVYLLFRGRDKALLPQVQHCLAEKLSLRVCMPEGRGRDFLNGDMDSQGAESGGPLGEVFLITLPELLQEALGESGEGEWTCRQWLHFREAGLLSLISGEVFLDNPEVGLERIRRALRYYPDVVWHGRMALMWRRYQVEGALLMRLIAAGDQVNICLALARQTEVLMRLGFLYARRYAPERRWLAMGCFELPPLLNQRMIEQVLLGADLPTQLAALEQLTGQAVAAHNAHADLPRLEMLGKGTGKSLTDRAGAYVHILRESLPEPVRTNLMLDRLLRDE